MVNPLVPSMRRPLSWAGVSSDEAVADTSRRTAAGPVPTRTQTSNDHPAPRLPLDWHSAKTLRSLGNAVGHVSTASLLNLAATSKTMNAYMEQPLLEHRAQWLRVLDGCERLATLHLPAAETLNEAEVVLKDVKALSADKRCEALGDLTGSLLALSQTADEAYAAGWTGVLNELADQLAALGASTGINIAHASTICSKVLANVLPANEDQRRLDDALAFMQAIRDPSPLQSRCKLELCSGIVDRRQHAPVELPVETAATRIGSSHPPTASEPRVPAGPTGRVDRPFESVERIGSAAENLSRPDLADFARSSTFVHNGVARPIQAGKELAAYTRWTQAVLMLCDEVQSLRGAKVAVTNATTLQDDDQCRALGKLVTPLIELSQQEPMGSAELLNLVAGQFSRLSTLPDPDLQSVKSASRKVLACTIPMTDAQNRLYDELRNLNSLVETSPDQRQRMLALCSALIQRD